MSTNTTNYNLVKPGLNETADIEAINQNMDVIDTGLKNVSDKADGKISKSLATAANQFLLSSAVGQFVAKTVDEIKSLLGLKGAAEKEFNSAGGVASYDTVQSHLSDYVRQPGYAVATGAANTYAASLNPGPTNYTDGLGIVVKINAANTGASTINVNGLGAKAVVDGKGNALTAGKLKINAIYSLKYNSAWGTFQLLGEGGDIPKLPNLIRNGDFGLGTNCWNFNSSTGSASNNILTYTASSQYGQVSQYIPNPAINDKLYMCCELKGALTSRFIFYFAAGNGNVLSPAVANTWQFLSGKFAYNPGSTNFYVAFDDTAVGGWQPTQIRNIMFFNLTQIFGPGNEPTKEEVDAMIFYSTNMVRNGNCEEGIGYWLNNNVAQNTLSIESGKFKLVTTNASGGYVRQYIKVKPNTNYYILANVSGASAGVYVYEPTLSNVLRTGSGVFNTGVNVEIVILLYVTISGTAYFDSIILVEGTVAPSGYKSYMPYGWWDNDGKLLISDTTALVGDVLAGKVFYGADMYRAVGTIPDRNSADTPANNISTVPGRLYLKPQTGYYDQTGPTSWIYKDDPNFVAANIASGKSIFGLAGSFAGKKWAKGTAYSDATNKSFRSTSGTQYYFSSITVTGLTFTPNYIIIRGEKNSSDSTINNTVYINDTNDLQYYRAALMFVVNRWQYNSMNFALRGDLEGASVTDTGFTLPVYDGERTYSWIAFE